ncbi:MAG: ABC transporter ATP-binding protein/permease, partial [Pontiellaceae bacterium]|nr:ABC transporter ATP-binding protein/permease [Pontiellaceae bacterium]
LVYLIKQSPAWVLPFLLARTINTLNDPTHYSLQGLWIYAVVTMILIAQNIPMHTCYVYLVSRAIRRMEFRLRAALVTRLQQLSIAFHDRTESGRLQAKVLRDVEQIQMLTMFMGEAGMAATTSSVFAVIVTAVRQPMLLFYFVAMVPLCLVLLHIFRKKMQARNTEFRSEIETMSAQVNEMITMIPVARAHGVETSAAESMSERFHSVNERGVSLDLINAVFGSASWVTFQVSMVVGLGVMGWLCWQGQISVGDIALYQSLFSMIVNSANMLLNAYPQIAKGIESIRSIGEVLECPDLEHNEGKRPVEKVDGHVVFEGVDFDYASGRGRAVIGFNLEVKPGECIALVGPSGAGKSTVINLLIGFRRPVAGRILLDGADMETIDMRTFRRHISVVPQETMLVSGTIRENILYGLNDAAEDRLRAAVEMANLHEFIDQLPDGLNTRIGEGGASLSGGQKQRVAIARALIRDPHILILDEATSALDVVAERQVQQAIETAVKNRTTFIVAHRLSTIRNADRIVVMNEGRIVETGSYSELMARRGAFFAMQQLQTLE